MPIDSAGLKRLFERQGWHFATLLFLLVAIYAVRDTPDLLSGELWGISTAGWLIVALAVPIIHQIYVWLIWRTHLETGWVTPPKFKVYTVVFVLMLAARLVSIIWLAVSNRATCTLPPAVRYGLALLLAIPSVYLGYSVARYFGIVRAVGADHFDEAYRHMPLVKAGIYRFTSNGMYIFGFMLLWIPGLLLASKAALMAALFNHIYIWIHYYCTEQPDMRRIYGNATMT